MIIDYAAIAALSAARRACYRDGIRPFLADETVRRYDLFNGVTVLAPTLDDVIAYGHMLLSVRADATNVIVPDCDGPAKLRA